jgi:hypothetical protein
MLFFFTDTPNRKVGKTDLMQNIEKTKGNEKKEQIKFIKGNPVRIRAVYSHQASVRHDVFCFKVKKKGEKGVSCGLIFVC